MVHLGLGICSEALSFWIPEKKKLSFANVREAILWQNKVLLKTLQRFVGKCQSFKLVFPAASLFIRECCLFMSSLDDTTLVPLTQQVRDEVLFWRFVDTFSEPIQWRQDRHISVQLSSDASGFKWGGVITLKEADVAFGDYWSPEVQQMTDICYKEALALYFVLLSVLDALWDHRVDVQVDSQSLYHTWTGLKAKSLALIGVLKLIFSLTLEANFDLTLQWVPSKRNLADAPSREISRADSRLVSALWIFLQRELGGQSGFTWDLMALPSNVQTGKDGMPLKFFSRWPVHGSSGVNIFAQPCPREEEMYAFPPFVLIPALIKLFQEWGDIGVTLVVPKHKHTRSWWPYLRSFVRQSLRLSEFGQEGVLEFPTHRGYIQNVVSLPFELWAFKCFFPSGTNISKEPELPASTIGPISI